MSTSAVLGLPFIAGQQSQPEVTHNQALVMLQALLNGAVAQQNAPPGSPAEGACYIVGTAPTGAWAARANALAIRFGGAWVFVPGVDSGGVAIAMGVEQEGMRVWNQALNAGVVWTGTAWVADSAMPEFTVATLPAATGPKRLIYVSDETGGAVPAFNDGASWRRVTDRSVVA